MAYLDLTPTITALRERPGDFDLVHGTLRHVPSRHRFRFGRDGGVQVETACDCSLLSISREHSASLRQAYREWHATYWLDVQINREFASHFRPPNLWRRLYRFVTARFRRGSDQQTVPSSATADIAAPRSAQVEAATARPEPLAV